MVVCVYFPRFELVIAAGGPRGLADGPVALAPGPGKQQCIGEISASAEAYGIQPGMRLGEALGRCSSLRLVMPDPMKVAAAWEQILQSLEGIGAAVESGPSGTAWFDGKGLRGLYGGGIEGVIAAARRALGRPVRIGAAPSRFGATAAARRARTRKAVIAPEIPRMLASFLAPFSVEILAVRPETAHLPESLERFGIRTLGELVALGRGALIQRFGKAGALAYDLARGYDQPVNPRQPTERIEETLKLPDSACAQQLERALGMLIDRLLAHPNRQGRAFRAVVISAVLVSEGTWSRHVTFRQALSDVHRIRLALATKLQELPDPATLLRLTVEGLGPAGAEQGTLLDNEVKASANLNEGVSQARAAAGADAALRIISIDPDSRIPERHFAFTSWQR